MEQINNQKENTAKQGNFNHQTLNIQGLKEFLQLQSVMPDNILNDLILIKNKSLVNFLTSGEPPKKYKLPYFTFNEKQKQGMLQGYFAECFNNSNSELSQYKITFYDLIDKLNISSNNQHTLFKLLDNYINAFINEFAKSKNLGLTFSLQGEIYDI